PKDSSAEVTSDGLLGGKYLALSPGGDATMLQPGGLITVTQSSISIEQLLGKFIFSAGNLASSVGSGKSGDGGQGDGSASSPGGTPAPARSP
ncbi:MAG: outer membrane lipid asymmetry maintenance protein MlaD, partial [Acetobacteraceae bacterium]|nr:outer membrane lipid asymmetry maintenance protein MlaD [Acetobacteraceae bacterium]